MIFKIDSRVGRTNNVTFNIFDENKILQTSLLLFQTNFPERLDMDMKCLEEHSKRCKNHFKYFKNA